MTKKSKSLGQMFINAAVREVGRNGGKVVSNKVYKNAHATPVSVKNSSNIVDNFEYPESEKFEYKETIKEPKVFSGFHVIAHFIFPFFILLYKAYQVFAAKSIDYCVYDATWLEENYKRDRRKKEGFRVDGFIRKNSTFKSKENEKDVLEYRERVEGTQMGRLLASFVFHAIWILGYFIL